MAILATIIPDPVFPLGVGLAKSNFACYYTYFRTALLSFYCCFYIAKTLTYRPRQLTIWAPCLVMIQKPPLFSSMEANLPAALKISLPVDLS